MKNFSPEEIRAYLFSKQDKKYRDFSIKLIPNIEEESIIGVRTKVLRDYAKELIKKQAYQYFIDELAHKYHEENNLHAFIIEKEKDFDKLIYLLDKFLPYINNWATCDSISPLVFKKHKKDTKKYISGLLEKDGTYIKRFAIVTSLKNFIKEGLDKDLFNKIINIKAEDYYLKMAIAWYISYVIIYHFDFAISYLKNSDLEDFVYKMSIQKAIDSRILSEDKKNILRDIKNKS